MTAQNAGELRGRLRGLGLSDGVIAAAWPRWWSDEAEASASARAELRFSVARRLGLDPRSLLEDRDAPRFLWRDQARFKHLSGESEEERAGITSFGRALASMLLGASPQPTAELAGVRAGALRAEMLASGRPFVTLVDLLSLCWALSVPVVHLRVFPWPQKRMAAMVAMVGARSTVLLGKDSSYPATIAFYLAHELGHVALGHVRADGQIVDFDDDVLGRSDEDEEEREADAFALELLTGSPDPVVLPTGPGRTHGRAVAHAALRSAEGLAVEPGTLALCFGHSTGDWRTANAALKLIYPDPRPVWSSVNMIARGQLELEELSVDASDYVDAVLGGTTE